MKSISALLVLLTLLRTTHSTAQESLINDQTSWAIGWSSIAGVQPQYYNYLCGDTLINDTLYQKLYEQFSTDSNPVYQFAIRKDGQKVWQRRNANETLLYDFSLEVNDSFYVHGSFPELYLIVKEVTTQMVDGVSRKKIQFENVHSFLGEYWLEGIGSSKGFAQRGTGYNTDGGTWICCLKTIDSDFLAGNMANCNCDYELDFNCSYMPTAIHLINNIKIEIFPNPATDYIEVKYSDMQSLKIEIFNLNGQLLNQTNEQHIILLDMLPNGVYSIKITDNASDVFIVDKFIVAK